MLQNSFHVIPVIAHTSAELICAVLHALLYMHFNVSLLSPAPATPSHTVFPHSSVSLPSLCIIDGVAESFGVVLQERGNN